MQRNYGIRAREVPESVHCRGCHPQHVAHLRWLRGWLLPTVMDCEERCCRCLWYASCDCGGMHRHLHLTRNHHGEEEGRDEKGFLLQYQDQPRLLIVAKLCALLRVVLG